MQALQHNTDDGRENLGHRRYLKEIVSSDKNDKSEIPDIKHPWNLRKHEKT